MSDASPLQRFWRWALASWATRSLAVGAVATGVDILVLLLCVKALGLPPTYGAMVGTTVGSTLTFFANRRFAFRDHENALPSQAFKFLLTTSVGILAHGACVWIFTGRLHIPLVVAKVMADLCVFSVAQLFLLRYVVFPAKVLAGAERTSRVQKSSPALRRARPRRVRPGREVSER